LFAGLEKGQGISVERGRVISAGFWENEDGLVVFNRYSSTLRDSLGKNLKRKRKILAAFG